VRRCILYFLLLTSAFLRSQLVFTSIPSDLQMIPRTSDNSGSFTLQGTCFTPSITGIRSVLRANSTSIVWQDAYSPLDGNGKFSTPHVVPAQLEDYDLEIYTVDIKNESVLQKTIKKLVAGDYFLVSGQSNAVAGAFANSQGHAEDSLYSNRYCRTIGTVFQLAAGAYSIEKDCEYKYPSSVYYIGGDSGCVGIWPLRVMHEVVKKTGIPVCILNGAMGATSLLDQMPSHFPSDPLQLRYTTDSALNIKARPYDRLFKKLYANQVIPGVKCILWYQGESDGTIGRDSAAIYLERFSKLRTGWKLDYPNLEKIFVFQVNEGCWGDNMGLVREQQRMLPEKLSDVHVMSTVGSYVEERSDDGCHYTHYGYDMLGEKMGPAVLKYLYHHDLKAEDIMPPNVKKVFFSASDEICIEFDKNVWVQSSQNYTYQTVTTAYIKDAFFKEGDTCIKLRDVSFNENKVYLKLEDTTRIINKLTYLPHLYTNIPTVYMGPWILNANNKKIGALSFFEFPVQQFPENNAMMVYPNPCNDYVVIKCKGDVRIKNLKLWNASGREILNTDYNDDKLIVKDLSTLERGLYYMEVNSTHGKQMRKLLLN
jgi:hypothetical protein